MKSAKKLKIKSSPSLYSAKQSESFVKESLPQIETPMDKLTVSITGLALMDTPVIEPKCFEIKILFQDHKIVDGIVNAADARSPVDKDTLLEGAMSYDPSDYEKMCMFADSPLYVCIQPMKASPRNLPSPRSNKSSNSESIHVKNFEDVYCCNMDILALFIDKDTMSVEKRLEPLITPEALHRKSWDNLPILTMELSVFRHKLLKQHHEVLKRANYMKMTLIAAYNIPLIHDTEAVYTAASKMPMHNDTNTGLVTFDAGQPALRFDAMNFYPKWEKLRQVTDFFTTSDDKFVGRHDELDNDDQIPLTDYVDMMPNNHAVMWGSFHRTLFLESSEPWLREHLRHYRWPFELHVHGDKGFSFMAFLDLFRLLYPGEARVRMAVPLQWTNPEAMMRACNCNQLLSANDKATMTSGTKSGSTTMTDLLSPHTGSDANCAFVIIEVKLARPLMSLQIPPHIHTEDIKVMLKDLELEDGAKRQCSGRGQLARDWQATVRAAADSIRRIPYYGQMEFCIFNRQLSETRTRVELITSFWQDAALYVNNNFAVQDFLRSDEIFEEMMMIAHACLMKTASETLVGMATRPVEPLLLAARHARQMLDTAHATDLYLQLVSQKRRDGNSWRELAVCLLDVDRDWANVCINKSVVLNPRHRLSLLTKGAMLFEEDPSLAETFFIALLTNNPFWTTGWVIASVYYSERELFHVADRIYEFVRQTHKEGLADERVEPRTWSHELGDWWDGCPLLPGMSHYYDAADLLLRLRAVTLAEACLTRALMESGESAAYIHMVALCCLLQGDMEEALCHLRTGIQKYGEISYLRALEAECYHRMKNIPMAMASFEKAGSCLGPYSTLLSTPVRECRARTILVDLVRRQPSAYAWMALADDWMMREPINECGDGSTSDEYMAAHTCAKACAVQALKWDRRAGRAWDLLSKLVHPSARRLHCNNMATAGLYEVTFSYIATCPLAKGNNSASSMHLDANMEATVNMTFYEKIIFDSLRVSIHNVTRDHKSFLWNYKVKDPCKHIIYAVLIKNLLGTDKNCNIKAGAYSVKLNLKDLMSRLFGPAFFYGSYFTKADITSKKERILCFVTAFDIVKKTGKV